MTRSTTNWYTSDRNHQPGRDRHRPTETRNGDRIMIEVTRYTQDGVTYICAGDSSTSVAAARKAAQDKLNAGETLADDMERIDGCCTWSVVTR